MYSLRVGDILDQTRLVTTAPDVPVNAAAKLMAFEQVGAILVIDDGQLVGIFTERDIAFRVVAQDLDCGRTQVHEVMTPAPITIESHKSFGYALLLMHDKRFRHLPVVEAGQLIGIVSARNALDPDLEEFVAESQRRVHLRREAD